MPLYRVLLRATASAEIFVNCSSPDEAKSIAEGAWSPKLHTFGVDPKVTAIKTSNVSQNLEDPTAWRIEEW